MYIKSLKTILLISVPLGLMLIISVSINTNLIDRSIVLGTTQILFILLSALIIIAIFSVIIFILYKKRTKLRLNENIEASETEEPLIDSINQNDTSRFFMLTEIDKKAREEEGNTFENEITLKKICEEFRNYAASQLKLYYDISDIRRFVGGLGVSHIMILQGMSGTGKTSLAYAFGDYLNNPSVVVPIQPMWKERTDLIGYYNEFTKRFNETTLLQKLYEASHDDRIYITILDEMNIARVEYYFAEFLSLLEVPDPTKRHLDVIPDVWDNDPVLLSKGRLIVPDNMWFIGTANNDDSTFSISDKVYDRAMVINLDKKAKLINTKKIESRSISAEKFRHLITEAQKKYEMSHRNLRRIKELDDYLIKHFQLTFGNRIMQQIMKYIPVIVACGGSELSAIDDIMSKKVLRKLETKNMVYVKSAAPGLISFIEELFGDTSMELCKEYIRNIEINA